jgi:glutathione S-transferase
MIELYKLQWSHFVEKVRWALDFKGLPWRGIDVIAFTKKEMQRFDCVQTVPLIHDPATGVAISDSSPIIRYLDERYPERPLFPDDPHDRQMTWRWMLWLDSTLGLHARRLAYTQVVIECPAILSQLFMPRVCGGLFTRPLLRSLAAPVLGAMLTRRFRFHRNREDRVHEALLAQLPAIATRLRRYGYLVGGQFGAADITLASLLRPLRIVPYFERHPDLQSLFEWQRDLFRAHGREITFAYEDLIRAQRERSGTMPARVRWMDGHVPPQDSRVEPPLLQVAGNDIHPVSQWTLLLALPAYLKLRWFSGVERVLCANAG